MRTYRYLRLPQGVLDIPKRMRDGLDLAPDGQAWNTSDQAASSGPADHETVVSWSGD